MKNQKHNLNVFRLISGKSTASIPDTTESARKTEKMLGYWPDKSGLFMRR